MNLTGENSNNKVKKASFPEIIGRTSMESKNTSPSDFTTINFKHKDDYARKREEVWTMFKHLDETFAKFGQKLNDDDGKTGFEETLKTVLEKDLKNINIHLHNYYDKPLNDKIQRGEI